MKWQTSTLNQKYIFDLIPSFLFWCFVDWKQNKIYVRGKKTPWKTPKTQPEIFFFNLKKSVLVFKYQQKISIAKWLHFALDIWPGPPKNPKAVKYKLEALINTAVGKGPPACLGETASMSIEDSSVSLSFGLVAPWPQLVVCTQLWFLAITCCAWHPFWHFPSWSPHPPLDMILSPCSPDTLVITRNKKFWSCGIQCDSH